MRSKDILWEGAWKRLSSHHPIHSAMPERAWDWHDENVPRIDGRTVIVTGAASGLGAHIARALSAKGGDVILADVDLEGAETVAREIRRTIPGVTPTARGLDLGDLCSIERFAERFTSGHAYLDLLINNAGIMTPPYGRTKEGYESQWGVNHLGHFVLTARLIGPLSKTPGSRVVTQSSIVHRGGRINFRDINSERSYRAWKAYKQSKLATLLFSRELHRRLDQMGLGAPISLACHPGLVDTPLYRNGKLMRMGLKPFMHGLNEGAMPALRAALDPEVKGGEIFGPDGWMEFKGRAVLVQPHRRGKDMDLARRVWDISEKMTDVNLSSILENALIGGNRP
jgi:NAD(P)-dependent dehydrogenase (short-subunit alcohol dehydrogenase family)